MKISKALFFIVLAISMLACQFCKPTTPAAPTQEAVALPSAIQGLVLHIGQLKDAAPDVSGDQSVLAFSLTGYALEVKDGQQVIHSPRVTVIPVREGAAQLSFLANFTTTNFGGLYLGDYIQDGVGVDVDGVKYVVKADNVTFGEMGVEIKLTPVQ